MQTPCWSRLLALTSFVVLSSCVVPEQNSGNWQALFDGASGAGWQQSGEQSWQFADGEISETADAGDTFLVSDARYRDFHLTLEFWVDDTINSGIFIRCASQQGIHPDICYELNIWDKHPRQEWRTGAVVFLASPLAHVDTVNRWNQYEIKAQGKRIQAWINGIQVADLQDERFSEGHIALQSVGAGVVRFRNIALKRFN